MKKTTLIIALAFISILGACGEAGNDNYNDDTVTAKSANSESLKDYAEEDYSDQPGIQNRQLIKSGSLQFETNNGEKTRETILNAIKTYKGLIVSDNTHDNEGEVEVHLSVQVPAKDFDALINAISDHAGELDYKNISISDVTEEYIDIQARISTKKQLEQRYLQILEKANTVQEMLEVESQLGILRGDIESYEGRLNYIKSRVAFSTLDITFYYKTEVVQEREDRSALIFGSVFAGIVLLLIARYIYNRRKVA